MLHLGNHILKQFDMRAGSFALIFVICFKLNTQIIKNTGKKLSCKLLVSILHLQFQDIGCLRVAHFQAGFCWVMFLQSTGADFAYYLFLAKTFQLPGDVSST